jgi:riboflavin synthase
MFTGLAQETGALISYVPHGRGARIAVSCTGAFSAEIAKGDSIAVNGCCLTAVQVSSGSIAFDAVAETVALTNLLDARPGTRLNLEKSLRVGDRLGGHFVAGHVDGLAVFRSAKLVDEEHLMEIELPAQLLRHCISKGSIAVNGVSLTIASLHESGVFIAVIPHTWRETNLSNLVPGAQVNIETDMIGKWVLKFLEGSDIKAPASKIDEDFLKRHGFA